MGLGGGGGKGAVLHSMWDFSSLTKNQTCASAMEAWNLNYQTTKNHWSHAFKCGRNLEKENYKLKSLNSHLKIQ